ncbi:MAG: glycosyltransferase [Clostridiales bacterium]|nr:glycosyltransferase [Clostridiales bacterium]
MKFLIQIPQLIYGGAEKVLVSFANDLVSRGHEVEILESYEKGFLKPQFDSRVTFNAICSKEYTKRYYASLEEIKEEKNILTKARKCMKLAFSKLVGYRRFAEHLSKKYYKDKKYDVAINYLEIESPEFMKTAICAKKYIQWYHTDALDKEVKENTDSMIFWYQKMDAIICVAESARQSFIETYPQLKNKTYTIYNFFDTEKIVKQAVEECIYSKPKSGAIRLLSVGRMTSPKAYLRFLGVLERLHEEGYDFQWYVLGDGIERKKIEAKIVELGLSEYVCLEGLTDNPYKYMKNCDLFVLPSEYEGFPTVTVEAKILKCSVLATDVSGIREQIIHGKTGWIVNNDENSIYAGLKYLLEHPEERKKLCVNDGIKDICENDIKYRKLMEIIAH